ncbi:MAG: aldo/keto reductase [bacterium]|nr:aldo/keto reductase [bacterium]
MLPLVLGTAQLGTPYGVANQQGQPNPQTAYRIVETAWSCGIREFDTAQTYGTSETVLGNALRLIGVQAEARIITKTDPALDHTDASVMRTAVAGSLERLSISCLSALLVRRACMEAWHKGLYEILRECQESGMVERVGVSVYTPDEALEALACEGVDIVELPTNVLDRRFERAGVFERAHAVGKMVYIRSVFLQGLLLLDPKELATHLHFAQSSLEEFATCARELAMTQHELALAYIKTQFPEAHVIVGAELPEQVEETARVWGCAPSLQAVQRIQEVFAAVDERILDPTQWPHA